MKKKVFAATVIMGALIALALTSCVQENTENFAKEDRAAAARAHRLLVWSGLLDSKIAASGFTPQAPLVDLSNHPELEWLWNMADNPNEGLLVAAMNTQERIEQLNDLYEELVNRIGIYYVDIG